MTAALRAGAFYGLALFAAGFALGTVRTVLVEPRVGPLAATLIETPLMLLLAWPLCRRVMTRAAAPTGPASCAAASLAASASLITAEIVLGLTLFGRSAAEQAEAFASPQGRLGLAAQIAACAIPLVYRPRR